MAEGADLLDDLFADIQPLQLQTNNKTVTAAAAPKFKPKLLPHTKLHKPSSSSTSKTSIPKTHDAIIPSDSHSHSQHVGGFQGVSNTKTKLQPQRKKLPDQPGSDGISDVNTTEILPDDGIQAVASVSEIDLLDNVSLEDPLFSTDETTINLSSKDKEEEENGRKVMFSVPEACSTESPDMLINQVPVTSEENQVNDVSETGVEEHTQNDEQGQNSESIAEKEQEDAPNLDEVFSFLYNTDPILEMDESYEDPNDGDYTVDEHNGTADANVDENDNVKRSSKRRNTAITHADANVDEGSPNKNKKLPHRVRRKRRKVDPTLLEMPENEINPRQISIRNLILLAEAKEKKWNKEAAVSSNGDTSSVPRRRREQEEFEFGDFEEENSQQASAPQETFEPTVKKLNYHTYMNRSSSRWTQSETELFYKGISQFGTDFAMIQQLFPNRTRHQIKLKFKNEDKKYPTRIRDAITHPLTDNSQFEKVIEILEIEADKVAPEESSQADHWKNEEEINEEDENFETSEYDLDNSGKHESVPNDNLDTLFNWDNQQIEGEEFVF